MTFDIYDLIEIKVKTGLACDPRVMFMYTLIADVTDLQYARIEEGCQGWPYPWKLFCLYIPK